MARVFVSYSRHNRRWVDRDDRHNVIPFLAASLRRQGVEFWYDHALVPGDRFRAVIEERIDSADSAILLVSQHFLNSDFVREVELPRIEKRAGRGELLVLPLLVGPCEWHELPIVSERQMLPPGPRPLIDFIERDAEWERVLHEILQAVKRQLARPLPQPPPPPPIGRASPEDRAALEHQVAHYTAEIGKLPFAASAFHGDLKALAERLWNGPEVSADLARVVASVYRLYAASILMSPTGSTRPGIQTAVPWIRRASESYPAFTDRAELDAAHRFLVEALIHQSAELDAKLLLAQVMRVAMVEASQREVDRQVETAYETLKSLLQQRTP